MASLFASLMVIPYGIPYGCSVVTVFTESGEEGEEGGLTIDQKAIAEIWLLSLSHTLLIR